MEIRIRVIPQAGRNIIKSENGIMRVYVTTPAQDGKANKAVVAILAEHYGVKKSHIQIIKGLKSRDKTIMIEGI